MIDDIRNKYKTIIFDVDGTLVPNKYNGKVSQQVKNLILNSRDKVNIGIASGRPLERVMPIFKELGLTFPCVVSGGAQIVDPVTGTVIWEQPILDEDVVILRELFNEKPYNVWIVDETQEVLYNADMVLKKPLSFFLSKILEEEADSIIAQLQHIPTLSISKVVAYHKGYVSLIITHVNATKQHAIHKIAELQELNCTGFIGVGDGYNDFALFNACGLKVAVGNAIPELKQKADYIAPTVQEDAAIHVIKKFMLN